MPGKGESKITAPNDEAAIARLQERLCDEANADESFAPSLLTLAMITEREPHPGMDEFDARYHLVKNPAKEGAGEPSEFMFETFGEEVASVRRHPAQCVWTLIQEDDVLWLAAGIRYVNRLGYFLSTRPWQDGEEIYLYGD